MTEQSAPLPSVSESESESQLEPPAEPQPDPAAESQPDPAAEPFAESSTEALIETSAETSGPATEASAEPPAAESTDQATSQQSRSRLSYWMISAAVVVALIALGVGAVTARFVLEQIEQDASRATVGDCLDAASDPNQLRRVECSSPEAAWTVVHRASNVSERNFSIPEIRQQLCDPAPDWKSAFWIARDGAGELLCLAPVG